MGSKDSVSPSSRHNSSIASSESTASLNELDGTTRTDVQGVALLKQIFPDESTEELRRLHHERINRLQYTAVESSAALEEEKHPPTARGKSRNTPQSRLGNRIMDRLPESLQHHWREHNLPHDFLRLPPTVAVRRFHEKDGRWHYEVVKDLQTRALEQYSNANASQPREEFVDLFYTAVVFRDIKVGLGLTLFEEGGVIRVHSLNGPSPASAARVGPLDGSFGPASKAGVRPGDVLVGINGHALLQSVSPVEGILQHAASSLLTSPDPVVLHLLQHQQSSAHPKAEQQHPQIQQSASSSSRQQSLLDTSDFLEDPPSVELSFQLEQTFRSTPTLPRLDNAGLHQFARILASRNVIKQGGEEASASRMLGQITERAREWEAEGSFTFSSQKSGEHTFVPLAGVRKALSLRIVNNFLDGGETAYTIWVHDAEERREWYAPIRYFRDFQDLRAATQALHPSISQLPFPKQGLSLFGSPVRNESASEREMKARQLEQFLRSLNTMVYTEELHPSIAEISVHVQSFLGCEAAVGWAGLLGLAPDESSYDFSTSTDHEDFVRVALKKSIQRYTYRLFLLPPLSSTVNHFVHLVLSSGPDRHDIECLEAEGRPVLKARAVEEIKQIQAFLNQLQEMILEGCSDDFRSIAGREDYESIYAKILGQENGGDGSWDRLVREAVREQIEIEVYVPLRGVVSRLLVNGWKFEDMEVHFKIRELWKRPDEFFHLSITDLKLLEPVAAILKKGVGQSTLPCVKLRAIVEAASEINRIFKSAERRGELSGRNQRMNSVYMGADDFLPIFIYCVVKASMERPCALCILLRTLCDPINRLGETGYYLASFEATITHLQELDLSEQRDEVQSSFISIPLDT